MSNEVVRGFYAGECNYAFHCLKFSFRFNISELSEAHNCTF